MKPSGDWLKQLGCSGAVLGVGLIVATSSASAESVSPMPVESVSSQPNSGLENSEVMLKLEAVVEQTKSEPVFAAETTLRAFEPNASLNNSPLASADSPETLAVSHSAADLSAVTHSNSKPTLEVVEADLNSSTSNLVAQETQPSQSEPTPQPEATPTPGAGQLDLSPEIIENSPVLQRWLRQVPNVLEEIRRDPSFRTRVRLGYSQFPSTDDASGFNVGVEDVFVGRTGLTLSGDYNGSFNGDRKSFGADLRYYVLPLGGYINIAPQVGYRNITTGNFSTDGVNVGGRLMLALSRTGAADISLTQSFVSPGSNEEVGITTLSLGYALTRNFRISTDFQKQNSKEDKDSRVGIVLEWMP